MTFKKGWLERQLETASNTVGNWSTTKREALTLNREGNTSTGQATAIKLTPGKKQAA